MSGIGGGIRRCLITFSYAQFNSLSYDMRSEEVLKTFDVEPEFLNNTYFIE